MRIALYQGKSAISRAIRWVTRSKYSHAAFLLDDGSVIEAWTPVVRHVGSLSEQHTPGTVVDIFRFQERLSQSEERHLLSILRRDIGVPYDYRSVLDFVTRSRGSTSRKKLFCSKLVFQRCADVGRRLLRRTEAWEVPPGWIARSPLLVFDGTITTT